MSSAEVKVIDGVSILHLDYSNVAIEDSQASLDGFATLIRAYPPRGALVVNDFSQVNFNSENVALLREYVRGNRPHIRAAAVVGITGLKKAIFRSVVILTGRSDLFLCDTIDEACRRLVGIARGRVPAPSTD
ncbi:MAG: hypothetical protein JST54_09830 [Deltaproteobacteria bacterium]|nr:hypothetical protein [Deltaproteobacteria bacterium]